MNIFYSFIGKLPSYIKETVYQTRLFFDGDIYLILDDTNSEHIESLKKFNVKLINYKDVVDNKITSLFRRYRNRIPINKSLGDRKLLFMRSMERFFLLEKSMEKYNLQNILFLELDNLIYDDPRNWKLGELVPDFTFMYDNVDRISTGIFFVKNTEKLKIVTDNMINFIINDRGFFAEMRANWVIRDKGFFLPIIWKEEKYDKLTYINFDKFNNSIFDAAALGIYLTGVDPFHLSYFDEKSPWKASQVNYTVYNYDWICDEKGRKRPYVLVNDKKILINNLHVHSKILSRGLSKIPDNI